MSGFWAPVQQSGPSQQADASMHSAHCHRVCVCERQHCVCDFTLDDFETHTVETTAAGPLEQAEPLRVLQMEQLL